MQETGVQEGWTPASLSLNVDAGAVDSRRRRWWYLINSSVSLKVGLIILIVYATAAVIGLLYTPHDPAATFVGQRFESPNGEFWFGTDRLGQDIFSRTLIATALDMRIAVMAVALSFVIGVFIGVVTGYFGGPLDFGIMRLLEIKAAFPGLIFALIVVAAIGPGELNLIIVLAFASFPVYARLVRAELLSKKNWQYAEAARMVGCSPLRVAFRHLLPNSIGPAMAYSAINAAYAILTVASLGYLGVGLQAGSAEWGSMIARGQPQVITGQWWVSFFPGLALLVLTTGFYLAGDGLRDVLDPRGRR